jgi:hypothetical protein
MANGNQYLATPFLNVARSIPAGVGDNAHNALNRTYITLNNHGEMMVSEWWVAWHEDE